MKILTAKQTKQLDEYTVKEQEISSLDLMERAAKAFSKWFVKTFDKSKPIIIFAGVGDNGGDGLAVARMLLARDFKVTIYEVRFTNKTTKDFDINLKRLKSKRLKSKKITKEFPDFPSDAIVIDAILGAGLNRPLSGYLEDLVKFINDNATCVISIDVPSGVFADAPTNATSIYAHKTFTFELPKLAFMFSENYARIGHWFVDTIDSSETMLSLMQTPYHYVDTNFVSKIYKAKSKFDHKGTNGHALLIMGSYGMMGAALLATEACLRSGTGLVTLHTPRCGYIIAQTARPEAIMSIDVEEEFFSKKDNIDQYAAIGIGCGLGKHDKTKKGLLELLKSTTAPLVLDADALNIIAAEKWQNFIPKGSILTPHLKEFTRLFGECMNDFERNELQLQQSKTLDITIILKGPHTSITTPNGKCYFNSTGNPGMATGGSGDVLSGIITGFLAQGYSTNDATILGVYIHGLAGDLAAKTLGYEAMIASDITKYLGEAFKQLSN